MLLNSKTWKCFQNRQQFSRHWKTMLSILTTFAVKSRKMLSKIEKMLLLHDLIDLPAYFDQINRKSTWWPQTWPAQNQKYFPAYCEIPSLSPLSTYYSKDWKKKVQLTLTVQVAVLVHELAVVQSVLLDLLGGGGLGRGDGCGGRVVRHVRRRRHRQSDGASFRRSTGPRAVR